MPSRNISTSMTLAPEELRRVPLFGMLDEAQLEWTCKRFVPRRFNKGWRVFEQGDDGDFLYLIGIGKIRVFLVNPDGREVTLRHYRVNEVFGELAVLDGGARSASAEALEQTTLFALSRVEFIKLMQMNFDLVQHVIRMLTERLRYTTVFTEQLAFLDAPGRLAARLLQLSSAEIASVEPVELRVTQHDLAAMVNSTREWVNQALQEFSAKGWIDIRRGTVVIRDRQGLQKIALHEEGR
jgi:CRP-like cAMP-binding protein